MSKFYLTIGLVILTIFILGLTLRIEKLENRVKYLEVELKTMQGNYYDSRSLNEIYRDMDKKTDNIMKELKK